MAGAVITMIYGTKGPLLTSAKRALAATSMFTYEPTFEQVTSRQSPEIDGYGGATVPSISRPSSAALARAEFPSPRVPHFYENEVILSFADSLLLALGASAYRPQAQSAGPSQLTSYQLLDAGALHGMNSPMSLDRLG